MLDSTNPTVKPTAQLKAIEDVTHRSRLHLPGWTITLGMLIVMATIFWGILGISSTGLVEDWQIYESFDKTGFSLSTIQFQITQIDRVFIPLIYAVGYILTPNSFIGLQILGICLFLSNGLVLYRIMQQLIPENSAIAFMTSVLFVIYPAETGWFNTRYYTHDLAVLAYLTATYLLLLYWKRPRWWLIIGIWAALLLSLGIVEAAYPLAVFTPLLLIWLQKGFIRRLRRVAILWYLIPVGMLVLTIYSLSSLSKTNGTYQNLLSNGLNADTDPLLARIPKYLSYVIHAYRRIFLDGWTDIFHQLSLHAFSLFTAASFLIVIIVPLGTIIVWRLITRFSLPVRSSTPLHYQSAFYEVIYNRRSSITLLGIGFATIGLGFLSFVPLPNHPFYTDRVYLFSSIGGAICTSVVIYGIASLVQRYKAFVLSAIFALIFGVAVIGAIGHAVGLRYDSGQDQLALAQFAQQMPSVPDGTTIVVFDDTRTLTSMNVWRFGLIWFSADLEAGLQYLYHQPSLALQLCYSHQGIWGSDYENCMLEANSVQLTKSGQTKTIPYNKIVAFSYQPDQGFTLLSTLPVGYRTPQNTGAFADYNPSALVNKNAPLPPRVYTLLESWPYVPFMPHALFPQHSIAFNLFEVNATPVGEGFQLPLLSDGWNGPWTVTTTASLHVLLAQNSDYRLTFHAFGDLQLADKLVVRINGIGIPLARANDATGATFTGLIPQVTLSLKLTDTLIEFHVNSASKSVTLNSDQSPSGVNIDWLNIDPISH